MNKNYNKQTLAKAGPNKLAFTLVELIVVITILAILLTIAFISLQGYSSQARDSKRLSDISNIKKSLELFSLNTGKYPEPDDKITVSYSGETLRYQGTVGNQVSSNLSRNLNEKPMDPSTGLEYTYSTTHSQTEYEVLGLYESDLIGFTSPNSPHPNPFPKGEGTRTLFISSTNAAIQDYPKIYGNYNGIYIKTSSFYVPTPSIINGNIWGNVDFVDDETLIKSQVITGGDNLPGVSTGGLDMSLSVYEGTMTEDSTDEEKIELVEAIQTAYSNSQLANDTMYADILSKTSTGEIVDFVDVVVLNKVENSTSNMGGQTTIDWNDITSVCSGVSIGTLVYESTNSNDDAGLTCEHDIAVCNGSGTGYIISACNLGATTVSIDWSVSGGEYFQWGRNKGFDYGDDTQELAAIENASYDVNNDLYGYVCNSSLLSYRYDWLVSQDDNLWGDNSGIGTDEQRQGPCPIGYHIPSSVDWSGIINAGDGNLWDIGGTITEGTDLQTVLKLPYSGYHHWSSKSFNYVGSTGGYWSSSPNGNKGDTMYFYSDSISPSYSYYRAVGFPIRCFKN